MTDFEGQMWDLVIAVLTAAEDDQTFKDFVAELERHEMMLVILGLTGLMEIAIEREGPGFKANLIAELIPLGSSR